MNSDCSGTSFYLKKLSGLIRVMCPKPTGSNHELPVLMLKEHPVKDALGHLT